MNTQLLIFGALAIGLAPTLPSTAGAQTSEIDGLKQQLAQLTERLSDLESRQAQREQQFIESASLSETQTRIVLDSKGLQIGSPAGNYSLRLDGGFQLDSRSFLGSSGGTDTFDTRRARPSLRGTFYQAWDWRLQYELDNASLYDAYLRYTYSDALRIKVGRQKTSVGLERLQSFASTPFPERGLSTNLTPTRDNGIQISGKILDSTVLYELGWFNGVENDGRADTDTGNSKTVSGRIFLTPWVQDKESALNGLGFGLGFSYGNEGGASAPRHRTVGRETFFSYNNGTTSEDQHSRINPNLYYYKGAFGLQAELVFDEQIFSRGGVSSDVETVAWSITPSYVLAGGSNSFGGVKLDKGASLAEGGKGAWLLAARYTGVNISDNVFDGLAATQLADPTASARQADSYGLALSWYPNANVRVIFAYDHTQFSGGADLEDESLFLSRLQYSF